MAVRLLDYRPFGAFRFFLATLVVVRHFIANIAPVAFADALRPYEIGKMAVLVFFALSGFVIFETANAVYLGKPGAFFLNRLLRIVPQFLLAVTVSIGLYVVFERLGVLHVARDETWIGAAAYSYTNVAVNMIGFLPLMDRFISSYNFLPIAWALRVEMAFYLIIVAALILQSGCARLFGLPWSFARFGVAFALLLTPFWALSLLGRAPPMLQFMPYFVFGGALYMLVAVGGRVPLTVAAISLAGVLCEFWMEETGGRFGAAAFVDFALLMTLMTGMTALAFARGAGFQQADRFLGDLTYPLYLSHSWVSLAFQSLTACDSFAGLGLAFAVAYLAAFLSWLAVEPAIGRLRDAVRGGSLYAAGAGPGASRKELGAV